MTESLVSIDWRKVAYSRDYASLHSQFKVARDLILSSSRILLSTHMNSDGDAIGSQVALYWDLIALGKHCQMINPSAVPENLTFLTGSEKIQQVVGNSGDFSLFDLILLLDVSTPSRLPGVYEEIRTSGKQIILIDHHENCNIDADVIITNPEASSTGELVWFLLLYLHSFDLSFLNKKITDPLYVALMTDTGGFRFPRTDAVVHYIVAELIAHGTDPAYIAEMLYGQMLLEQSHLLGEALLRMQTYLNGQLCLMVIPYEVLQKYDAEGISTEGFVEYTMAIKGVKVGVLIVEYPGLIKMSFRSKGSIPANRIAGEFGGGGHRNAAGARVSNMALKDVIQSLLSVTQSYLVIPAEK